jgi:hypothetical protein
VNQTPPAVVATSQPEVNMSSIRTKMHALVDPWPFAWVEIRCSATGAAVLRRAGALTPYFAQTIVEDVIRCGQHGQLDVGLPDDVSTETVGRVRAAFAAVAALGATVVVARCGEQARRRPADAARSPESIVLELAARTGGVLGAIEEERGVAELFVASRGTKMRGELESRQPVTDVALDGLAELLRKHADDLPEVATVPARAALDRLANRDRTRRAVERLSIKPEAAFDYYSAAARPLLDVTGAIAEAAPHVQQTQCAKAFHVLLRIRESVAVEREQLALALETSVPLTMVRAALHVLLDAQALLFDAFATYAAPAALEALDRRSDDPVFAEVARVERRVLDGDPAELDAQAWFRAASAKLDQLREVEAMQLAALAQPSHGAMLH